MQHLVLATALALTVSGCVSSGDDRELANEVSQYLRATNVVPPTNSGMSQQANGKTSYVAPGINGSPHFIYYGVTSPDEMQALKAAAETAAKELAKVKSITLHFYEREVMIRSADGSSRRGKENEIAKFVIKRS